MRCHTIGTGGFMGILGLDEVMEVGKIQRLLWLITLLHSGRARGVDDLMTELHVSRRTLFRDLKMLQAAGIPCYFENPTGYRIAGHFFLPPANLTVPAEIVVEDGCTDH